MTTTTLCIAVPMIALGVLFILAIVGGKKCVHCNRNVQEDGRCADEDCANQASSDKNHARK